MYVRSLQTKQATHNKRKQERERERERERKKEMAHFTAIRDHPARGPRCGADHQASRKALSLIMRAQQPRAADDEGAHVDGQSGLRPRDRLLGLTHFVNRIISGFR